MGRSTSLRPIYDLACLLAHRWRGEFLYFCLGSDRDLSVGLDRGSWINQRVVGRYIVCQHLLGVWNWGNDYFADDGWSPCLLVPSSQIQPQQLWGFLVALLFSWRSVMPMTVGISLLVSCLVYAAACMVVVCTGTTVHQLTNWTGGANIPCTAGPVMYLPCLVDGGSLRNKISRWVDLIGVWSNGDRRRTHRLTLMPAFINPLLPS